MQRVGPQSAPSTDTSRNIIRSFKSRVNGPFKATHLGTTKGERKEERKKKKKNFVQTRGILFGFFSSNVICWLFISTPETEKNNVASCLCFLVIEFLTWKFFLFEKKIIVQKGEKSLGGNTSWETLRGKFPLPKSFGQVIFFSTPHLSVPLSSLERIILCSVEKNKVSL